MHGEVKIEKLPREHIVMPANAFQPINFYYLGTFSFSSALLKILLISLIIALIL